MQYPLLIRHGVFQDRLEALGKRVLRSVAATRRKPAQQLKSIFYLTEGLGDVVDSDVLRPPFPSEAQRGGTEPAMESRIQSFELAYRMQMDAADAFDISKEPGCAP